MHWYREIAARLSELQATYPEPAAAAEVLASARRLYWDLGIDPLQEAAFLGGASSACHSGQGLYEVNTAVDAANLASLSYFLPVGLYDFDRVDGDVTLRLGRDGELRRHR
ncbi:MAG: hypothetical protein R3E12_12425 [Candidatus Eisenbacteria bacterium]